MENMGRLCPKNKVFFFSWPNRNLVQFCYQILPPKQDFDQK